jgi:D-lyxose ketol-isomerase
MKEEAVKGRDSTRDMIARIGRASRLGERSRGAVDAGAASCCLIINTMADSAAVLLKTRSNEYAKARYRAIKMFKESGINITNDEEQKIIVNDFELGNLEKEGAQILEWLNTERVGVRLIALLPFQTLPEHYHRAAADEAGKEETIRVDSGTLYVYLPGEENITHGFIPEGHEKYYTVRHEVVMKIGEQLTLAPGTMHWFQAGEEGVVMYTFTSQARDRHNVFTNPRTTKGCVNELE